MSSTSSLARWLSGIALIALVGAAAPAVAQELLPPEAISGDEPAVLTADEVVNDQTLGLVIARGNVEISQGGRLLRADSIIYDAANNVVAASGNITLVEPTGETLFANYAELTGDLKDGFVQGVSLRLADNSRMIATGGARIGGTVLRADRAVYSPCLLCEDDPRAAPLWQIRAASITHDAVAKDVIYRDAFLDLFGLPVLYTPYFSHPDPSVTRRTGFLAPAMGSSADLGLFLRSYYYIDISPEQDATIELAATEDAGVLLGGEYRRRFENGLIEVTGSVNESDLIESVDDNLVTRRDEFRWHLFGRARFDLNDHWRAGADIERASDDTYLEVFDFTGDDLLTSRAYAEGFYGLSYASVEAFAFQDLRLDDIEQAVIAPLAQYDYVSEPGQLWGGQLFGNASLMALWREDGPSGLSPTEGVDTRRLSLSGGWQRTDYLPFGMVTDLRASVRGDLYWSDDVGDGMGGQEEGVTATRLLPRLTATARYPFVRQTATAQWLVEPIAQFSAAPSIGNDNDIPNNDSLDVEFDEINLFSESRYPGIDLVDDGLRFTYGIKAGIYGHSGHSSTIFLGQSYQFAGDNEFPAGSGLEEDFSDLVGRITLNPSRYFNFDWRFRLNTDGFEARRNEIRTTIGTDDYRVTGTYTFVKDVTELPTSEDTEEISLGASARLTDYWTATAAFTHDLENSETRSYSVGLRYLDECFELDTRIQHDFTEDRDNSAGVSIYVRVNFLNLGAVEF